MSENRIQREIKWDWAKAVAIYMVCSIHGGYLLSRDVSETTVLLQMSCVCVPIFIVVFAVFSSRGRYAKFSEQTKKAINRFFNLLWIYLISSTIYALWTVDRTVEFDILKFFTKHWMGYGWSGQYFLLLMLQLVWVVVPLSRLATRIHYAIVFFGLLSYGLVAYSPLNTPTILHKLGNSPFFVWLPYVSIGCLIERFHGAKSGSECRESGLWLCGLTPVFLALIPTEIFLFNPDPYAGKAYFLCSVFIATLGIVSVLAISNMKSGRLRAFDPIMSFVGARTLGIFVLNPAVILLLSPFIKWSPEGVVSGLLGWLFSGLLVLVISIAATNVLRMTPLRRLGI